MKSYVSQAGLAKRLAMSENSIGARLRARGIAPDAVLIQPAGRPDGLLFSVERLPELRGLLGSKPIESEIQS